MNAIKGTMFMIQGKQGWSESWVLTSPGAISDLSPYIITLRNLATARRGLFGSDCSIDALKVTDISTGSKRRTLVDGPGPSGSFATKSANADACALVRFWDAGQFNFVMRPLRAVPQADYASNQAISISVAYQAALVAFKQQLINDAWGWLTKGTATTSNISAVANTPGQPTVVTVTGTPFNPLLIGQKIQVRIKGVLGATELNGVQAAIVNTASSIALPRVTAIDPWTAITGQVVSYATPVFHRVFDGAFQRMDERKTGRPSYTSRGRRPALRHI